MHSDRTPSNLDSIEDKIVVLATYLDDARNGKRAPHMPEHQQQTSAITAATAHTDADLGDSPVIQSLHVLPCRCGEGVVRATPSTFRKEVLLCVCASEQRKLGDPEKVRLGR